MKILLTGAAGFIGSHLANALIKENHAVIGVDNFITGRWENIRALTGNANFKIIEHDVISPLKISDDLDWVMHFASPASPPKYLEHNIETLRVNSEGTLHLLELAKDKNAAFFLASTSETYGDPSIHPQPESYWGNVNPIGVRSVYDESKRFAEALVSAYHRKYGLSARIIRIFNTYGPNMDLDDGRVVTNFIKQAFKKLPITIYGDGLQTRSFQYIDDLIDGILGLMKIKYYEPVNLGNPGEYTILELAKVISSLSKNGSKFIFEALPIDDPKRRKPDISLAKRLFDWQPKVQLLDGLKMTINYFSEKLITF
jgi:nucleoside-diphosphate-sugar epimerase